MYKEFKYQLDNTSKKFKCPSCNQKRFVRFVDVETKNYVDDKYGRCDREYNCGYFLHPKEAAPHYQYHYKSKKIEPIVPSFIPIEIQTKSLVNYEINPLVNYLLKSFTESEVFGVVERYQIGTAEMYNGSTVFYQIDTKNNIRGGKIMGYNSDTGKRKKSVKAEINWVHSVLELPNFNLDRCLFGLHLVKKTTKKVAVVESEKTAVYMSLKLPQYVWVATGGSSSFNLKMLEPLSDREVIAFPDKGEAFSKWKCVADELNSLGYRITVSDILEDKDLEMGGDLMDVILKFKNQDSADKA